MKRNISALPQPAHYEQKNAVSFLHITVLSFYFILLGCLFLIKKNGEMRGNNNNCLLEYAFFHRQADWAD